MVKKYALERVAYVRNEHIRDLIEGIFHHTNSIYVISFSPYLKDKYPNFEVGLKCIIMVFQY